MQTPEIRPTGQAELEAISRLERENFSFPWPLSDFERMLEGGDKMLLCAVLDGVCLGYIGLYILPDGAEIMTLAVEMAARGRGVGGLLVSEALRRLRRCGVQTVFLEVRAGNAAARALYERCGFVLCGARRGYYKKPTEDAALYRLDFPSGKTGA